ncbi:MAG: LuxR C-terminal-related transcriptional regulator, partial [Kiritimatiellaeota bacterium]|nr:LuxR C-terminal-related transcriptional regulator [Kiritimatiellota bacterium]
TLAGARGVPWECPDAAAAAIGERSMRLFAEGALAYLRGEFERAKHAFGAIEDDAARLYACSLAAAAAVSTGDWLLWREIEGYCQKQASRGALAGIVAEWALTSVYTGAYVPSMIPEWLKNGEFGHLPVALRLETFYRYAKWLQYEKRHEAALAVAQAGLAFYERGHGITGAGVYLRISAAIACSQLNRLDKAYAYLADVMADCMPLGLITPFVESSPHLGGLVEQLVEQRYPAYVDAVARQTLQTIPNWMMFHNRHAAKRITPLLTPQEYQIAKAAVSGASRQEIAERFHLSQGTVKNKMSKIYQTLFIYGKNRNEQLAKHIL